jgi:dTDP-4-dehydrorhamnose reductase
MRVLVLGAAGMLGHRVFLTLLTAHDVWGTVRGRPADYRQSMPRSGEKLLGPVDVLNPDEIVRVVATVRPDAIVNCVGIVKQLAEAHDPLLSISTNSLLPHRLALVAGSCGARLIHISTDCVFSGQTGNYTEADRPDADDLYGRTKLLGEVTAGSCLTLRTSIIGPELHSRNGLLEWLLHVDTPLVKGYRRAIFSGLSTLELSNVIARVLDMFPGLAGLYHVASEPIDKFSLLSLLKEAYGLKIRIEPVDQPRINRSLDGSRFRSLTGYSAPPWPEIIRQMVEADQ